VPIVPLYGHQALRERLRASVSRHALPSSLLIHGPRGIGKQRLALWLGQLLLCSAATSDARPCGACRDCRYALDLVHPDLRWFFPRPRLTDSESNAERALDDLADATAARVAAGGLYEPPSGTEAIFVATVRGLLRGAAYTPTIATRKVFVIGDADRMVPQEGAEAAANAFLKLLEEPPVDTTLILTSSEPGALLPTIRSRVVAVRAAPLPEDDLRAFLDNDAVRAALAERQDDVSLTDRVRAAHGAPGALLAAGREAETRAAARALLDAATSGRAAHAQAALALGASRARGAFTEVLNALTLLLHERVSDAARAESQERAVAAARLVARVEDAKRRASGNVSPQLIGAALLRDFATVTT
jgi:DNA polymerase-3 subunit delta'